MTAGSGQEAITILDTDPATFDCLLFDIHQMPRLDGITLCRHVRSDPRYVRTPIIMLTAMSQTHYLDHAFAAGASDYMTKPFDYRDLLDKLRTWQRNDLAFNTPQHTTDAFGARTLAPALTAGSDLSARLETLDLPKHLGYRAFENFCTRRAQRRLRRFNVSALRIANFDQLCAETQPALLTQGLLAFARRLSGAVSRIDGLFSYRGNGVCLIAHTGAPDILHARLPAMLRPPSRMPDPQPQRLYTIGAPIRIRRASDAIFALGDAIRSVQNRHIARAIDHVPADSLGRMYHKEELSHLEARGYRGLFDTDMRDADTTWPPSGWGRTPEKGNARIYACKTDKPRLSGEIFSVSEKITGIFASPCLIMASKIYY